MSTRAGRLVLALMLLAGCASGPSEHERVYALRAPAGPAQLLYAPVGTRILLVNAVNGAPSESQITVERSQGIFGLYAGSDGRRGAFLPGCWGCAPGMGIEPEAYAALWPLETGKRVRFVRRGRDGTEAAVTIRVVGPEQIETPLGTFDTVVLEGRVDNIDGPRYSAQIRSWWAPGLGWVIKSAGGDSRGNTVESQIADFTLS